MKYKIISVFFDENGNPFKDVAREVPCSIINGAFIGASNTTKVYFYYDKLLNEDDDPVTWVAVSKLPNGKIGSKVLESYLDEDTDEHYALLELDSFYTQYKGDVYLALQGYQGGVQVLEDSETGIYTIVGTPTIQTTGNIRLNILYTPQFIGSDETENVNFQQILADLSTKLGIRTQTILVNELPAIGEDNVFYVIENDSENPNKANIYIWNGKTQSYVWVGDNSLFLGDYYTTEQATIFENGIKARVNAVENELSSVASGSPAGVYATLSDLTTADPNHDRIYVVTDTGNWYYWDGSQWENGGEYLSGPFDDELDTQSTNALQNKVVTNTFYPQIYNLAKKDDCTIGYYLDAYGVPTYINETRAYSDYVEVEQGHSYIGRHAYGLIVGVLYDESKNMLGIIDPATASTTLYEDLTALTGSLGYTTLNWYSVKIKSSSVKYIRYNIMITGNDTFFMFVENDGTNTYPTTFEDYNPQFKDQIFKNGIEQIATSKANEQINLVVKEDTLHNVFVGKTTFSGNTGTNAVAYNVALGDLSLAKLQHTTGDSGRYNTAVGSYSMKETTSGNHNTAIGFQSMSANTTGNYNTALGEDALLSNTSGESNVAFGCRAMQNFTTGNYNIAIGVSAMYDPNKTPTGSHNIAIGSSAYTGVNQGSYNIVIGDYSYTGSNYQHSVVVGSGVHNTKNNQVLIGSSGSSSISFVVSGRILELQFNQDGSVTWQDITPQ